MRRVRTACVQGALALLMAAALSAQTGPVRGTALEVTGVRHGQLDRAASPVAYAGGGRALGLMRYGGSERSRFELGGWFGAGTLRSDLTVGGRPSEDIWMGRFGVLYLQRVGTVAAGRIEFFLGGDISAHGSFRTHRYPLQGTEVFADLFVPLSAVAGAEWDAGVLRVGQRASVPVVGVVARTPYGGLKYVPPVQVAGPLDLTGFRHELFASGPVASFLAVRAGWSLNVLHHDQPRGLDMATHRFTLAAVLRRGGGS